MPRASDSFSAEPEGHIQYDEAVFGGIHLKLPTKAICCAALDEVKHKVHEVLLKTKGTNFGSLAPNRWVFHSSKLMNAGGSASFAACSRGVGPKF